MTDRKHFIIVDVLNVPPLIIKILKTFSSSSEYLIIPLEAPPEIGHGFVSFSPLVEGEEFGGYLNVPSHSVLMLGSSSSNTLGFLNTAAD
jgi:hypothetical protein